MYIKKCSQFPLESSWSICTLISKSIYRSVFHNTKFQRSLRHLEVIRHILTCLYKQRFLIFNIFKSHHDFHLFFVKIDVIYICHLFKMLMKENKRFWFKIIFISRSAGYCLLPCIYNIFSIPPKLYYFRFESFSLKNVSKLKKYNFYKRSRRKFGKWEFSRLMLFWWYLLRIKQ